MSNPLIRSFHLVVLAGFGLAVSAAFSAPSEGLAIALVYDTSGSMKEMVASGTAGKPQPKYVVAQEALNKIIDRVEAFSVKPGGGRRAPVEAGLFIFKGDNAAAAVPFGAWNAAAFHRWLNNYQGPDGSTPLGRAVEEAARAVLRSEMPRKHIVVVTDGLNTMGPDPGSVLRRLNREPNAKQKFSVHLVAFDVAASVFEPLKKEGATVVGAADARQLQSQLEYIFEQKILLEEEETPAPKKP